MDVKHPETIPSDSEFICDICGKKLSTSVTLKTHRRLIHHTKKILYFKFCRVCQVYIDKDEDAKAQLGETDDKGPSYRASLLRHFELLHPEELLLCPHAEDQNCNKKFVRKALMIQHVAAAHADGVNRCGG